MFTEIILIDSSPLLSQFAAGHDDLTPLSKSFIDDFNGWGATAVDAMDTLYIMGLTVGSSIFAPTD